MAKDKGDKGDKGAGEGSGISDEDWEAFERSFTKESTKSATYKEPSARQRELTSKWKKEPPKDTGWRTDGPQADLRPKGGTGGTYGGGIASEDRPWNQKKKRVWVRNLTWSLVASLIVAGILWAPKLFSSHASSDNGVHPTIPFGQSASASETASASTGSKPGAVEFTVPPLDPSRAAILDKPWPAIDAKAALPAAVSAAGQSFRLVTTKVSLTCTEQMSQSLGDLVAAGPGCQQLVQGLYTEPAHKEQITVSVLSMKRVEDATLVISAMKVGGLDYQLQELDAPADSGLPLIPNGAPGLTENVMTVRSVVVVGAQYSDGGDHGKQPIEGHAAALLKAVSDKVTAYEESRAR